MNITEAVRRIEQVSDDAVLVAKPPLTWGSDAMYIELTDDYGIPQPVSDDGWQYVLGHEDLMRLVGFTRVKAISDRAVAEFVIHYAEKDAYPAWFDDLRSK